MEVPQLIIDLAIMMTTAAVVTITFKKLRIPAILGYILAGFLISPYFPLFINTQSEASVETWSEIGVVIILFHIGLEFDFNKLSEIGSTALVSAAVKMGGVLLVGYGFGLLLGMSTMNSVYLGVMLSISSTVVIQKCFDEMGLAHEKYANLVMGSLVMEDVIAVFMMVVLTTVAASQNQSAGGMALHMFLMITYLIIWLVLGIYFLPTFLDRVMGLMSDETLTLLSIGFCFLMAMLAHWLGFSMELGAFIAGSFFAGNCRDKRYVWCSVLPLCWHDGGPCDNHRALDLHNPDRDSGCDRQADICIHRNDAFGSGYEHCSQRRHFACSHRRILIYHCDPGYIAWGDRKLSLPGDSGIIYPYHNNDANTYKAIRKYSGAGQKDNARQTASYGKKLYIR